MISVSKTPAAPAGSTTPVAPGTPETAASPFDTILSLESLAATSAALNPGSLEGDALESLGESLGNDDEGDPDETDGEAEGPLAFLVNLLNMAAASAPHSQAGVDGSADGAVDDALGGQGKQAATAADAGTLAQATQAAQTADARAAAALLAGDATDKSTPADATPSTDSTTANLARAAEMLAQAPRHAAPARDTIATPTHSPRWADDFSARVAMMVRGGESTASLQLTPADLGPVDINVTVRDSQATIHFGASQADTRALLEASIPRLREMLAAQGFNLMDASVSQGFARQPRSDAPTPARLDAVTETEAQLTTRVTALGLLDTYA
jgi:flagellar hook-length control protein FliK